MGCGLSTDGISSSSDRAGPSGMTAIVKHCPYGHRLFKRNRALFTCDACKNTFFMGESCYSCICGVDACEKCFSMPITCQGKHILYESRMRQPFKCDICSVEQRRYGTIARSCRKCNFDCCKTHEKDPAPASSNNNNNADPAAANVSPSPASPTPAAPVATPQFKPPVPAQQAPSSTSNFRSLFIGINYYNSSAELAGCVRDVAVARDMVKKMGFDLSTDCRVLVDDRSFAGRTGHPDRKSILESLEWLVTGANENTNAFLHFSGHGCTVADRDRDEDDGQDEALVPVDYEKNGVILDDESLTILKKLPKGARLTIVNDSCHSGSIYDMKYIWKWEGEEKKFTMPNKTRDFAFSSAKKIDGDVIAISGCQDSQTSADVSDVQSFNLYLGKESPGKAGGALTSALASAVQQKYNTGDKKMSCSYMELFYIIQQDLKKRRFTQIPQLSASKKFDMNADFTLFGPLPQA